MLLFSSQWASRIPEQVKNGHLSGHAVDDTEHAQRRHCVIQGSLDTSEFCNKV